MLFWINAARRYHEMRNYKRLTVQQLRAKSEQRVAIFIPCWQEDEVVDRMLDFACRSIEYQNYDIFVGVYPNDPTRSNVSDQIASIHGRIIRHQRARRPDHQGSKPQPDVSRHGAHEGDEPYQIIVLHDVEDIIHPLSLLMYNFLMPEKEMVQLPVFPLERPWTKWTAWTYADEFAQNHLKDMVFREQIGGFVPSAGVGCAFSRAALDIVLITSDDVFPRGTLTEDYQIALRLHTKGLRTIFVNQNLAASGRGLRRRRPHTSRRERIFPIRRSTRSSRSRAGSPASAFKPGT